MMRRRTMVLGAVALLVVGGGAYVAKRLADGGRVTEIGVEGAVDRYREQLTTVTATTTIDSTVDSPADTTVTSPVVPTSPVATSASTPVATVATSAPPVAVTLPAPGVYAYATVGFDSVDVLTGARHDYPSVTTVTVTPNGCGIRLRWDVAVERWDSWDWCLAGNAVRADGWTGFHEFFGVAGQQDYVCTGDPRPLDAEPGTTWEMVCRSGDADVSTFHGTVVERTSTTIGGISVPSLHVRYDVDVSGGSTGSQTIEDWYRTTDSLLLKEVLSTSTVQDTAIGRAAFEERSTIELISLTPAS